MTKIINKLMHHLQIPQHGISVAEVPRLRELGISVHHFLFLTIILFCASGCGQDSSLIDKPTVQPKIELYLAPGDSPQSNITGVELTVSIDEEPFQQVPDVNLKLEQRTAITTIEEVPVGSNITFSARAFEGNCPVLSGSLENVEITQNARIIISLAPIQIVIGIRSEQDQLSVGEPYVLEAYVENAPELFAFTCELEFDSNLLEPQGVTPGDFFGEDVLYLMVAENKSWTNTTPEGNELSENQEGNRLSLGITRKADAAGVCGGGVVFRITFGTMGAGDAEIALVKSDKLELRTPDFEKIEDARIQIEPGTPVRIE